jgi:hypothetical protein
MEPIQDDRPRTITCTTCGGYMVYAVWNGDYDIVDCHECAGGTLVVYPNDTLAMYPGGPMRGSWPGAYAKAGGV